MIKYLQIITAISIACSCFCSEHVQERASASVQRDSSKNSLEAQENLLVQDILLLREHERLLRQRNKLSIFSDTTIDSSHMENLHVELRTKELEFLVILLHYEWQKESPALFDAALQVFLEKIVLSENRAVALESIKKWNFVQPLEEFIVRNLDKLIAFKFHHGAQPLYEKKPVSSTKKNVASETADMQQDSSSMPRETASSSHARTAQDSNSEIPLKDFAIPRGLVNRGGNTCYVNSILQSLSVLEKMMLAVKAQKSDADSYYVQNSLARTYQNFIQCYLDGHSMNDVHKGLCEQSCKIMQQVDRERRDPQAQQDANEYLLHLLDDITDVSVRKEIHSRYPFYEPDVPGKRISDLSVLFYVRTTSALVYPPRKFRSEPKVEYHAAIALPIDSDQDTSLYECLRHYFEDQVEFELPSKEKVTATKELHLNEMDEYIILSLRRNQWNKRAQTHRRSAAKISFPLKGLSFRDYYERVNKTVRTTEYDLVACVLHSGTADFGHYTALVKKNHQWFECNDENIARIPEDEIEAIAYQGYYKNALPVLFIYQQAHIDTSKPAEAASGRNSQPRNAKTPAAAPSSSNLHKQSSFEKVQKSDNEQQKKATANAATTSDSARVSRLNTEFVNAVSSREIEKVKILLDAGADIEIRDKEGRTALHSAVSKGFLEIVRILIKAGANREVCDKFGLTPLKIAENKGMIAIITLLKADYIGK